MLHFYQHMKKWALLTIVVRDNPYGPLCNSWWWVKTVQKIFVLMSKLKKKSPILSNFPWRQHRAVGSYRQRINTPCLKAKCCWGFGWRSRRIMFWMWKAGWSWSAACVLQSAQEQQFHSVGPVSCKTKPEDDMQHGRKNESRGSASFSE